MARADAQGIRLEELPYGWILAWTGVGRHVVLSSYVLYVVAEETFGHLVHFVPVGRHDFVPSLVYARNLLSNKVRVSATHDVLYADLLCDV
jgi:hypothetical protein